jgi:hypothetical protein
MFQLASKALVFLLPPLLTIIIGCSAKQPIVAQNKPDIISIYESEVDTIKDLGDGWFEVKGTAVIQNISPEDAEKKAILNACRDAIQYYSGVEISERTLDLQAAGHGKVIIDHFSSLTSQTIGGIILEKNILHKEIKTDGNNLVNLVVLRVKVGKQEGQKDPYFHLNAHLNSDTFKEGEELELTARASKDCYITVLNICSDDSVNVLFPNQYRSDNFLKAGDIFKLPSRVDKMMGLSFPVTLANGKECDVEMIKVLATKEEISLVESHTFSPYGTYKMALKKLLNWLIKIPRSEVEEADLQYFMTR